VHHLVDLEALDKVRRPAAKVTVQSQGFLVCLRQAVGPDGMVEREDVPGFVGKEVLSIRQVDSHFIKYFAPCDTYKMNAEEVVRMLKERVGDKGVTLDPKHKWFGFLDVLDGRMERMNDLSDSDNELKPS
jgi:hypothetical protein